MDAGKSWTSLNDGDLAGKQIRAITAIDNTIFVGTDKGLYRRNLDGWEQLKVGDVENIRALASAENRLYVAVGREVKKQSLSTVMSISILINTSLSLYRSTDLGDSWQSMELLKPVPDESERFGTNSRPYNPNVDSHSETKNVPSVKIAAVQEKLLVLDGVNSYYSSDAGETWVSLDSIPSNTRLTSAVILSNADTLYRSGAFGIQRTTDAGKTWHYFNTGLVRTSVTNLAYVDRALYAEIWGGLVVSYDSGESWVPVRRCPAAFISLMNCNDVLYVKGIKEFSPQIFRVSVEDNALTPIPGMPSLRGSDYGAENEKFKTDFGELSQGELEEGAELKSEDSDINGTNAAANKAITKNIVEIIYEYFAGFAVSSSGTYYVEYEQKLFRWEPGMAEWFDTGLVGGEVPPDFLENVQHQSSIGFKIAVSGEIVYVGRPDGSLFQSFDEGDTWNDVTPNLPFSVTQFKSIIFAGSTLYVATDKGVAHSSDGINWHTATTDAGGTPIVIEKIAVDGTTVYGAPQQQKQIYQLKENSRTWEPVTPEIPSSVISFAVGGNVLYVGTTGHGVFRYAIPSE